ncbi:carboxyl-terminal-processing peptidase chloroplastic [Raphidocelis subcapitata]|uniref:C-terminal processing peptidase n=1 Tax=Raphidocelis subcapitata TaxID=307507 RepID=A0A2V0P6G4_9CHLO|nr:carboxyl-terminal-processing peptidase chloroplastic [Raphidocelis subcapitata]|eukprot:GBF95448.1 carboxyl-terminal-processing peptidase chloroplastic [Raphidocelis subcapitata]
MQHMASGRARPLGRRPQAGAARAARAGASGSGEPHRRQRQRQQAQCETAENGLWQGAQQASLKCPSLLVSLAARRAALAALAAATALAAAAVPPPPPAAAVTAEQLFFLEAWRAVDKAYVDKQFNGQSWFRVKEDYLKRVPMSNRGQTYDAIRQLLASLGDPFTRFLEPERLAALRRGTAGSVTGVGVEITFGEPRKGGPPELAVVTPTPGGPAARAGVRAGDVIESIGGVPTAGMSLYEASDLLQGPEGTEVTLRVRSGGRASRDVTLQRQRVKITPVTYELCSGVAEAALPKGASAPGRLGYIRLATFNGNTAAASADAIEALRKEGVDGFVLDIRSNGGGLFPAGVAVARQWVDRGEVVLIADSQGVRDIYSADGNSLDAATPLAVLVNKGTASAAEVLAGALRDNGRATIVGGPTYGKGLIQTVVDLSDGSGLAVGIAPDIAIDDSLDESPEPGKLPPPGGDSVCRLLASDAAPRLFKK